MKVIVINLKDRKDRLEQFCKEWSWLNYEVSEGIRDDILHKGCGLAHINAIRMGLKNNDWCLILEDDAILNCSKEFFITLINQVTENITWDAIFLGANSHTIFPIPTTIKRINDYFFTVSQTKSLRSCTAMLWSKKSLPIIDQYEKILQQNHVFAIDRMLLSFCYPWEIVNGEWDESKEFNKIDLIPIVWICKECLVLQKEGIFSDNTLKNSLKYDNESRFTKLLFSYAGLTGTNDSAIISVS
jgi:GR25 family glycosyltransferase involved in LPS biosynthesis